MVRKFYFIGAIEADAGPDLGNGCQYIFFNPPERSTIGGAAISVFDGISKYDSGSTRPAGAWLHHRRKSIVWSGGKPQVLEAAEGWFERICTAAGGAWFLDFAGRLARHEPVTLDEIKNAFRCGHNGMEIPEGDTVWDVIAQARTSGLVRQTASA